MICDTDQHIIKITARDAWQQHTYEYVAEYLMCLYELPYKERINGNYVVVHFALTHAETRDDLNTRYWSFGVNLDDKRLLQGNTFDIHDKEKVINFVKMRMLDKIKETNDKFPSYFLRPTLIY